MTTPEQRSSLPTGESANQEVKPVPSPEEIAKNHCPSCDPLNGDSYECNCFCEEIAEAIREDRQRQQAARKAVKLPVRTRAYTVQEVHAALEAAGVEWTEGGE